MLEAKAKDTGASVLQNFFSGDLKKEKKVLKKIFQAISKRGKQKKVLANFSRSFWRFRTKF